VDDSLGLITCNVWKNDNQTYPSKDFELGDLVNIQGRLGTFKNQIRINVTHIRNGKQFDV
jgi:hypothetical protein